MAALLAALAAPASAGSFASGTLGLTIGLLPPITVGSNASAFTISAGGSLTEPAGVFGPISATMPRTLFTGISGISGFTVGPLLNGTKVVTGAGSPGGGLGGSGGLQGTAVVNVLGLINVTIPLSVVGSPGAAFTQAHLTLIGGGWGTGPQVITGITTTTPGNAVLHTVTFTGSQMGTLSGMATVTLISAFKVVNGAGVGNLPGLASQTLRFVPEPAALLLVGTGVAGVLIVGLRRVAGGGA